jgi:pSer/pThr/pTyr-binding forkhead associated (FHA) protein
MAKLIVTEGPSKGKAFDLTGKTLFLGRSAKSDIKIIDQYVSRKHLKIFFITNALFIEDQKSTNGTFVNGEFLKPGEGYQVGPEDVIMLGRNTKIRMEGLPVKSQIVIKDIDRNLETVQKDVKQKLGQEKRSRSLNQVKLVSSLSEDLASKLELDDFILKMLGTLLKALPRIDRVAVLLKTENKEEAEPFAILGSSDQGHRSLPFDKEIIKRTLKERKPIFVANTGDKRLPGLTISRATAKIMSVAAVPIDSGSKTYGVLYLDGIKGPYAFREEDFSLLKTLSNYAATALANRPSFSYKRKLALISFLPTYFFLFVVAFLLVYYSPHLSGLINIQILSLLRISPAHFLVNLPYGLILAVPFFFFGMLAIFRNLMSSYELDRDGLRLIKGAFAIKEYYLAFQDLDDISFKQNLFELPFRLGTLILKSGRGGELRVKGIHNVKRVVERMRRKGQVEKSQYYKTRH